MLLPPPPPLVLASRSARRQKIFEQLNLSFQILPSPFDERSVAWQGEGGSYVEQVALGKAKPLQESHPDELIVAADTMVIQGQAALGKPESWEEAVEMLGRLQGRWHSVYTGVCISWKGVIHSCYCKTDLLFNPLALQQIEAYLRTIDWHDRAGSYAFGLERSGLLIAQLRGCYYNVIGLPLNELEQLFNRFGYSLWSTLAQAKPFSVQLNGH